MSETGLDTLLVGIDAGCIQVLERLAEENRVPTIQRVCDAGVAGDLESQIPPWTPSAWPSLYTGVNPGRHGVFGFVGYDGYDWYVVSRDDVCEHPIWTILDRHGYGSVVVNVPVTYPPDEIDGAIVPGFIGPESPTCHPEGTLDDLRAAIGDYRVYPRYSRGSNEWSDAEKLAEYRRLVEMRGEAFRYLVDRHDPAFGFVQFQRTDTVFHEFEGDWEKVAPVYEATDQQIAATLEDCDPDRIFLASDHGIGRYEKYEFRVNEYLRDKGFLETATGGKGMPSWNPIRDQLREGHEEDTWEPGVAGRLAAAAATAGLTTDRIGAVLRPLGLDGLARRLAPDGVTRTASEQVDFPASEAYMRARTELGVRINLEGREPDGVVPQSEYDAVRRDLIEQLRHVATPDGEPMFEDVAPRERYFEGPYTDRAVDVVTVPNDFEQFLSAQVLDGYFAQPTEPWNHKMAGVFAAAGAGIDADADLQEAHLFDVAPTILSAMGVPYSDRMDGRVLPVVEDVGARDYPEHRDARSASREDAMVRDRLADLGYLE